MIATIRRYIEFVVVWLKRVVTQPRSELDRWQRAALFTYDLSRFGARQMRHDRAPQMAAALSFRVLFGLLPVLIVATILVRQVIGIDDFMNRLGTVLDDMGLANIQVMDRSQSEAVIADTDGNPPAGEQPERQQQSMTLKEWLESLVGQAAEINVAAVGWVGLALIIYAAISLMVTIENIFNTIYRAPEGRSWSRRVPLYWFILTISPAVLGLAAYLDGTIDSLIDSGQNWEWAVTIGSFLWVVMIEWLFMFAVYTLVPNTEVSAKPAAIGAVITVFLLEIGKRSMGVYLSNAFTISHLYGSLGLVPLFMFWVYLMWLGVLFGLQVSATLQMLHGRRLDEIERKRQSMGLIDPAAVLTVMEIVTSRFNRGKQTSAQRIAEEASLPLHVISQILTRLADEGLVHRLESEEESVSLAQPPAQISADRLLDIGFAMADATADGRRGSLLERLRETQRKLAAQMTLESLVPPNPDAANIAAEPPGAAGG